MQKFPIINFLNFLVPLYTEQTDYVMVDILESGAYFMLFQQLKIKVSFFKNLKMKYLI